MKPRIRLIFVMLALTLVVPASASANPWASIASLPLCVADTLPAATTATDTTTVPSGWRNTPVNVNLDGTDHQGFEWKIDCGATETGPTATFATTGTYSFLHRVQEAGTGHWTPWVEHVVRVDTTPPVDTSTIPVGWQHDKAVITLSGTDVGAGLSHMIYKLNDGAEVPVALGADPFEITANGTHTLTTSAVDLAGNRSAPRVSIVQVDSAGPVDTTTVPAGWVTDPTVDVTVQGTDVGGSGVNQIEWELVEDVRSGTVAGPGPVTVTVSGEGVHTLRTRLTDGDGRSSSWKTQQVRIDTVLPTDHTNVTSAWLPRNSFDVTVRGTDATSGVASVEYRINGGAVVPVAGDTATATITGTGEHELETRVVDHAGNTTGWVEHTVRLDPDSPVNSTPAASSAWRQTAYTVRLNGHDELSGVARMEWKVDNGAPLDTRVATVSGEGVQTLSTRLVDIAGNASVWRDETIRIDSVKPTDTTTVPATVPRGRKIPITGTDALSGLSGAVEWQVDNGAVKTTPQASISTAGPHVLKTRVQDNAGNWSEWRTFNVTVDTTTDDADPPVDTTAVQDRWYHAPQTVTVSAEDDGTGVKEVQYRVDGRPIVSVRAATATFTVAEDGVYEIETRAIDDVGNESAWRSHTLRIDQTLPVDTTELPADWVKSRDITLSATDETSGVASITYQVGGGPETTVPGDHAAITLPADGTHTVKRRVTDHAGQKTGWATSTVKVDSVVPVNTSPTAPTAWQATALSLPLTGTDTGGSGVDRFEYRIGTETKTGTPAVVATDGTHTLQTRVVDKAGNASTWRSDTVRVDLTKPVNTTPVVTQAWRNTNFATTVSGSDGASGVDRVEWKLDTGAVSTSPAVAIAVEGHYKLWTRVVDVAGNDSGWRLDQVGIDKTAPALAADCGPAVWRNTPVACAVSADGGLSGVAALTGARGGEGPTEVAGGAYTVAAEGQSTVNFRVVDGAGNEAVKQATVKIDRTAPAATVTCAPDAKSLNYACVAGGSDGLSGLAGLSWSVDGGPATPIAPGATFTVAKGTVVVRAVDQAGNTGASAPVGLAERHTEPQAVTPRRASEAVLIRGKAKSSKRLVGQLTMAATPTATTVDLRPLALGKGTFQLVIKVTVGKKSKTVKKTQKTVKGYTKRITVKTRAGATAKVTLTVKRKSGKRWVSHAKASARL